MPLNPLGLYYLTVHGEIHSQSTQNGFFFQTRSNSLGTSYLQEATELLDNFEAGVLPRMKDFASDDWLVKTLLVTTLIPRSTVLLEKRIAVGSGIQPDDSVPSFCAGLLSLRTGFGGRSTHGRLYFAGVPEGGSSGGLLEGTNLAQLTAIGTALTTRYGAGGTFNRCRYGVFSRKIGTYRSPGPPPLIMWEHIGFYPITEIVARNRIASMRKRQRPYAR